MQVSAVAMPKTTGFRGYEDQEYPVASYRHRSLDDVDFQSIADTLTKKGADKVTSPTKFFAASAACVLAAFLASRAALCGAFNKIDANFGTFETLGKKAAVALVDLTNAHPLKEGKGFKIYLNNKLHNFGDFVAQYGKKFVPAEAAAKVSEAELPAKYAAAAIKRGTANALGVGVAGATVQSRYQDSDNNGVPDKAEGKLSMVKEAASLLPQLVDAAGL